MDDYIFLIIAVVISIFAAVKKNKKKEVAAPQRQQPRQPGNFFFDQFLNENVQEKPADEFDFPDWPSMEPEKKPVMPPLVVPQQPKAYDIPREVFKSHLPEKRKTMVQLSVKKIVQEEETVEAEETETSTDLEDFTLRKAVIYSEILKPKFENTQTTLF